MKFKVIFWLAIMNILCACQTQAQEVTLSENDYKELETSYKGAKVIYEFSKAQRDFASYIEADKSTSLQAIISTYLELKQAWETIQELRSFYGSGKDAVKLNVNLETVRVLKGSAISIPA